MDNYYLEHHGIKGQKWGVRRFQNPDGSLTSEGEKRYYDGGNAGRKGIRNMRKDGITKQIRDARYNYDKEYANSERGKKLRSQIQKLNDDSYKALWEDDNPDDDKVNSLYKQLDKATATYLKERGQYRAERIVKDFGAELASLNSSKGKQMVSDGKKAVDMLAKEWTGEEYDWH